ncbi:MAG: Uma2 family endonuclease [Chloroflexi bacterium]|nr:Uma2 family endonuclease [Chloroflexota bacterium]
METIHWTSKDLEILPDNNGTHYEIINGELYVSRQPHKHHQLVCTRIWMILQMWSIQTDNGEAVAGPGLIFTDDNDVAPDVTWMSNERLATTYQADGKYHAAPDLAVEVLSPGTTNEQRDREFKLWLYSRRGVLEYWIVSWMHRRVEMYRRDEGQLKLHATLYQNDTIESPYLPGFTCQVNEFFYDISRKLPSAPQ